jgi:hypothetical protein
MLEDALATLQAHADLLHAVKHAAEVIGAVILEAIGAELLASTVIIGTLTVATAVGTAVILAGSIGLQLLLNRPNRASIPGGPALPPPEAGHQPVRQTSASRIVGYGRVRLAGAYMLFEASNKVSYDVIALHHGRIAGFVGFYLHDDVVTLGGGGVVNGMADGRYGTGKVTIATHLGTDPETAFGAIISGLFPIWTAAHRGDGIASLMLKCDPVAAIGDFPTIFPRGLPLPSAVMDCTPIYDWRDGAQAAGNSATWKVSANPVVQLVDFLTNADRGMGLAWATLITPVIAALTVEANLCDAGVARADGGSEPRYASNGSFPLDSDPADVISSILDTCDGWISQNGDGSLALKVGVYRAPTIALSSKHVRGVSLQYDLADEEVVNELTLDYTEPQLDYKTVPGRPWRDETDISARGKTRSQRFALPWVYSHPQARRLAKRRMAQFRAPLRGTLTTTLYGLRALGERWVLVDVPDITADLVGLVVEIRAMTIDLLNASVTFKFVSVNPNSIDAWDPATEENSAASIPGKLVFPPPPVPANVAAIPDPVFLAGNFIVSFDDPGRSDLLYQVEWRVNGSGGSFLTESNTGGTLASGRVSVKAGRTAPFPATYEVKVRSFAPSGPPSAFSSSTTVTVVGP